MKERIREIAGELMQTAAAPRAAAGRRCWSRTTAATASSSTASLMQETDDQDRAIGDVLGDLAAASRWTGWSAATSASARPRWRCAPPSSRRWPGMQVAVVCPHHPARAPALPAISSSASTASRSKIGRLSRLVPAAEAKATREGLADGKIDIVIGTHAMLAKARRIQAARPGDRRRGTALRRHPQGAAEGARPTSTCSR